MNAPFERGHLRLIEPPLTAEEVAQRPTLEEVRSLWAQVRRGPIPDYGKLRRLVVR